MRVSMVDDSPPNTSNGRRRRLSHVMGMPLLLGIFFLSLGLVESLDLRKPLVKSMLAAQRSLLLLQNQKPPQNSKRPGPVETWDQLWNRAIALYSEAETSPTWLASTRRSNNKQEELLEQQEVLLDELTKLIVTLGKCRPLPTSAPNADDRPPLTKEQISLLQGGLDAIEAQLLLPPLPPVAPPPISSLTASGGDMLGSSQEQEADRVLLDAAGTIEKALANPNVNFEQVYELVEAYAKAKASLDESSILRHEHSTKAVLPESQIQSTIDSSSSSSSKPSSPWFMMDAVLNMLAGKKKASPKPVVKNSQSSVEPTPIDFVKSKLSTWQDQKPKQFDYQDEEFTPFGSSASKESRVTQKTKKTRRVVVRSSQGTPLVARPEPEQPPALFVDETQSSQKMERADKSDSSRLTSSSPSLESPEFRGKPFFANVTDSDSKASESATLPDPTPASPPPEEKVIEQVSKAAPPASDDPPPPEEKVIEEASKAAPPASDDPPSLVPTQSNNQPENSSSTNLPTETASPPSPDFLQNPLLQQRSRLAKQLEDTLLSDTGEQDPIQLFVDSLSQPDSETRETPGPPVTSEGTAQARRSMDSAPKTEAAETLQTSQDYPTPKAPTSETTMAQQMEDLLLSDTGNEDPVQMFVDSLKQETPPGNSKSTAEELTASSGMEENVTARIEDFIESLRDIREDENSSFDEGNAPTTSETNRQARMQQDYTATRTTDGIPSERGNSGFSSAERTRNPAPYPSETSGTFGVLRSFGRPNKNKEVPKELRDSYSKDLDTDDDNALAVFEVGPNLRRLERAILLYLIDNTPTLEEIKEASRKTMEATMEFAEEARPYMEAGLAEAWKNLGKAWGASYRTAAQTLYLARRGYQSTLDTDSKKVVEETQYASGAEQENQAPADQRYDASAVPQNENNGLGTTQQKSIAELAAEWSARNGGTSQSTWQVAQKEPAPPSTIPPDAAVLETTKVSSPYYDPECSYEEKLKLINSTDYLKSNPMGPPPTFVPPPKSPRRSTEAPSSPPRDAAIPETKVSSPYYDTECSYEEKLKLINSTDYLKSNPMGRPPPFVPPIPSGQTVEATRTDSRSLADVSDLKTEIWSNLASEWANINSEKPTSSNGGQPLVSDMTQDTLQYGAQEIDDQAKAPPARQDHQGWLNMAEAWASRNGDAVEERQPKISSSVEPRPILGGELQGKAIDESEALSAGPEFAEERKPEKEWTETNKRTGARITLHSGSPDFGAMYDKTMKQFADESTASFLNEEEKAADKAKGKTMTELAQEWASMNGEVDSSYHHYSHYQANSSPTPASTPPLTSMEDLAREWSNMNRDQQP